MLAGQHRDQEQHGWTPVQPTFRQIVLNFVLRFSSVLTGGVVAVILTFAHLTYKSSPPKYFSLMFSTLYGTYHLLDGICTSAVQCSAVEYTSVEICVAVHCSTVECTTVECSTEEYTTVEGNKVQTTVQYMTGYCS